VVGKNAATIFLPNDGEKWWFTTVENQATDLSFSKIAEIRQKNSALLKARDVVFTLPEP